MINSRWKKWAIHMACMGELRVLYRVFVRMPESKIALERPRLWWEDNIKMDVRELGIHGAN
jgi:hypothetical protein